MLECVKEEKELVLREQKNELQITDKTVFEDPLGLEPPNFNKVSIKNGHNIHLGNKIIVQGVLHVNNLVGDSTKVDNECWFHASNNAKRENGDISRNHKEKPIQDVEWSILRLLNFSTKSYFIIAAILILLILVASLTYYLVSSSKGKIKDVAEYEENYENSEKENLLSKVKIIKRHEWLAQPPKDPPENLTLPVPLVIILHTASDPCFKYPKCVLSVRLIQTFHIEGRSWNDIAYNFLIGGDGYVYEGRGWDTVGSHTFTYNIKSIGIAFIGLYNYITPLPRQLLAAKLLIAEGVKLGKIDLDYQLMAHTNLSSTESPGLAFFNEIKKWPHFTEIYKEV